MNNHGPRKVSLFAVFLLLAVFSMIPSQASAANPIGFLDSATYVGPNQIRVTGWTIDSDSPATSLSVHVYIDSQGFARTANKYRPDVGAAYPGYGNYHGFDETINATLSGNNNVCAYGINVGTGTNALLGCKIVTTPEFYGINAERPFEYLVKDNTSVAGNLSWSNYTFETDITVKEISKTNGQAGIIFLSDGTNNNCYYLGLIPDQNKWKLWKITSGVFSLLTTGDIAINLNSTYRTKVSINYPTISININGSTWNATVSGRSSGKIGLSVRYSKAAFDNVKVNNGTLFTDDFSAGTSKWTPVNMQCWNIVNYAYEGSVHISGSQMIAASSTFDARFRMLQAMGAKSVRGIFSWDIIQPVSSTHQYWDEITGTYTNFFWSYFDAMAIAAHNHGMDIVPILMKTPKWAVPLANQTDPYYSAYPPTNNTYYANFVKAVVNRYKPGGAFAQRQGWTDSYGTATYFEIGPEFNMGKYYDNDSSSFTGWIGTIGQYVDLLKAGRDAVKASDACPTCKVLSGGAADDVLPSYYENVYKSYDRKDYPSFYGRQYLWQGVEDLYAEIARRGGNPDNYFDILSIHTYEWWMFSAQGQYPDLYRSYAYPDSRWYSDRISKVIGVMGRYGDAEKKIWLTETGYPSVNQNGVCDSPTLGCMSMQAQADALKIIYQTSSAYSQLEKVFWWQGFDEFHTGNLGLIRNDSGLSPKPAYTAYAQLTGYATPVLTCAASSYYWASYADYLSRLLSVNYQVTNTGGTATNIKVSSVIATNGATLYTPSTPFMLNPPILATNATSDTFTLKYSVPMGVTGFKQTFTLEYKDMNGDVRYLTSAVSNPPAPPTP